MTDYCTRAAKPIGRKFRNAITVLATLFLLFFAKFQRTLIAALSFTLIPRKKVWVYGGIVDNLEGRYIPLFLAAGVLGQEVETIL